MIPNIVQVIPYDDFTVQVYFEDGKIVSYDVKPLLDKPIFKPLNDLSFFKDRCMILNDTLAWDITGDRNESTCLDIAPDTLYRLTGVTERIA